MPTSRLPTRVSISITLTNQGRMQDFGEGGGGGGGGGGSDMNY